LRAGDRVRFRPTNLAAPRAHNGGGKKLREEKISMALSARNHLKGEITEVVLGTVTALITVKVGDNIVESVITRRSAEELGLKKGDKVSAVIKATEVMIQKG